MAAVTAVQVAAFLGRPGDPDVMALADEHLAVITPMVRTYTRGVGFDPVTGEPASDLAAVIVAASARLIANPEQLGHTVGEVGFRGGFVGFSLAELGTLNAHRRRAA